MMVIIMRIQIINYSREACDGDTVYSKLSAPRSLDEFEMNIIDLTHNAIWRSGEHSTVATSLKSICSFDLKSINGMIQRSETSKVLFVLPQDIEFLIYKGSEINRYGKKTPLYDRVRIKDVLARVQNGIYSIFAPIDPYFETVYENTTTTIDGIQYNAAFSFTEGFAALTKSDISNKSTTIKADERVFLTSLDLFSSEEKWVHYIKNVFGTENREQVPPWINKIKFNDDSDLEEEIKSQNQTICEANKIINTAETKLKINQRYKSILYSNGAELVDVVFEILGKLLECDFSDFKDEKREDFRVKVRDYTLIGEIKGVSTNVKYEHISQLEVHYQHYQDVLQENKQKENVRQLLIINPFRNKPLAEREDVHKDQINLAKRNGSLIIDTYTLLRIFELFLQGKITTEECLTLFVERTGILTLEK